MCCWSEILKYSNTAARTKQGTTIQLAADTVEDRTDWKQYFKAKKAEKYALEPLKGFLWLLQDNKWTRYYFIGDGDTMEWFNTSAKEVVRIAPLSTLSEYACTHKHARGSTTHAHRHSFIHKLCCTLGGCATWQNRHMRRWQSRKRVL